MPNSYRITQVSAQPPRQWDGPTGTVFYIKVKLDGHERPVSIGKKSPDALHVGDTVYGTITGTDRDEDKFKSEQQQTSFGGGTSSKPAYVPRDDLAIRAQWALGQGMTAAYNNEVGNLAEVEMLARELFAMVDRVKEPVPTRAQVDDEVANAIDMFTKKEDDF